MSARPVSPALAQTLRRFLHAIFPATPKAANALSDSLVAIQQHDLWTIEDLNPKQASGILLKTVQLSHLLTINLAHFRLALAHNPGLLKLSTQDVAQSIDEMEKLATRLSTTCRELLIAGDLSAETMFHYCNSLDGTLVNLQIECQFFTLALLGSDPDRPE